MYLRIFYYQQKNYKMYYNDSIDQQLGDELFSLQNAYDNLQNAYRLKDRSSMINGFTNAMALNIPGIKQNIRFEITKLFPENSKILCVPIGQLPVDQLFININGCLTALKNEIYFRNLYQSNNFYAQHILFQPHHVFYITDILNANSSGQLTVENLLSVLKYAISIAELIKPEDEDYLRASYSITILQEIEAILNNKPTGKPINKLLHLMTGFLSTAVKASLNDNFVKQTVTITAIMLDLTIDFFVKK